MPDRYSIPDLSYPHYRILKATTTSQLDGSNTSIILTDTQFSHTSYAFASKRVDELRRGLTNRANANKYSVVISRKTNNGADVVLIDDARTEIRLRIHDAGRYGELKPRGQTWLKFGGKEDYLSKIGFHVDFDQPGVNLADTVMRWQNLDGYNGISVPTRGFRGGSIDGRVVTMKRKR